MQTEVFTIGHSTLDYESFLALLKDARITAVADVRTSPASRHFPHFNRDALKEELRRDKIAYVFLGNELGGRPKDSQFYCDDVADYEKMATDERFILGIDRVIDGTAKYRIALMCSEHNPMDCHRCLLVGRALLERGLKVNHILQNGKQISQEQIEEQLVRECGHGSDDMFAKGRARIADAYRERARQISFRKPTLKAAQEP